MYIAMIIQFTKEYLVTGNYIAHCTYVKLSLLSVAPYQAYVEIPLHNLIKLYVIQTFNNELQHINQIVWKSRKTLTTNSSILETQKKKQNKSYRNTIDIDTLITE